MSKKVKQSTEKTLQNQRIAIWLIVGFVAFITLWFVYSVKTLQNTSMTISSEAVSGSQAVKPGRACTRVDNTRYKKGKDGGYMNGTQRAMLYCCKKPGTAQYVWNYTQCPARQ